MYSSLVNTYADHWRKFLTERSLGLEWLKLYSSTPPPPTESVSVEGLDELVEGDEDEDGNEPEDSDCAADPEFEELFADL